jgi:hypothetical protein
LKGLLCRGFVAVALVAAIGAPAASAKSGPRVDLALLPLPASAIGPAAKSLQLQHDSGVLVGGGNLANKIYVGAGLPTTPNRAFIPVVGFGNIGWRAGYALDYGVGSSGGTGITEVRTSVDRYRSKLDAKKGLALWHSVDPRICAWAGGGLAILKKAVSVPPVGTRRFAFLVSYADSNLAPLFGLDEQFTEGRFEADVSVWAGTAAAASKLAPELARKLDARIELALAGNLRAKAVGLPPKQKAQQWPGGPDLARLALKPTDLGGRPAPAFEDNYFVGEDPFALSYFKVTMFNVGQFDAVGQEIEWYGTANQATFTEDLDTGSVARYSMDVGSIGDGARATSSPTYAEIHFASGRLFEFIHLESETAGSIQPADVQRIAQTAASYIDAAGLGS